MGAPRVVISGIGVVSTFGVGRETLAMIDEVGGSNELRAQALNVIGTSQTKLGDRNGLKELERSIEITQPGSYERMAEIFAVQLKLSQM